MKKKTRLWLIISLVIIALSAIHCSNGNEEKSSAEIAELTMLELLPENTQFLVRFGALETLYKQFAVTHNSVLGIPLEEKDMKKIKADLGFNPLNPEMVKAAGFDTGKPSCLAIMNIQVNADNTEKSNFDLLSLLPVSDGAKALETIRFSFDNNNVDYENISKNDLSLIKWAAPEANGCLAVKDEYLYLSVNPQTDPQSFLESVLKTDSSLPNAKAFSELISGTDFGRELVFYVNIANIVDTNLGPLKQIMAEQQSPQRPDAAAVFESVKEYSAGTMTADLNNPSFIVDTVVSLAPDSDIKRIWEPGRIDREKVLSINDPAVLLLSFGADFMQYYKMITEMMPPEEYESLKTRLDSVREKSGIDVKEELIDNLSGSVNLATYDGASITMLNYNTLFTAGVKDEKVIKEAIDKAIKLLPPDKQAMISRRKIGNMDAYVINAGLVQVYAGIDKNKFLLASGKPMFEKALGDQKNSGFAANLVDMQLKNSLLSNQNIFYLNLDELIKIVNNFAMFLIDPAGGEQKFKDKMNAAGRFEYILSSSKLDGDRITSVFTVKTRFGRPFFAGVADLIEKLKLHDQSPNVQQE